MDLYSFGYDVWLRGFQPIPAHGHKPLFISVFGNRLELAPRMGAPNWNSRYPVRAPVQQCFYWRAIFCRH